MVLLVLLLTASGCWCRQTHLLTSCTGRDLSGWNYKKVPEHIEMWVKGMVTVRGRGDVQSRLFSTKYDNFSEHMISRDRIPDPDKDNSGVVNKENKLTIGHFDSNYPKGDHITYVYPDFQTGLHGRFVNGTAVSAIEVKIVAQRCSQEILQLKLLETLSYSHVTWKEEQVNNSFIGSKPTIMDPHERKSVYVKTSDLENMSLTDGLYARKSFLPGQLISYYNGLRGLYSFFTKKNMTVEEQEEVEATMFNIDKKEDYYPKGYVLTVPVKYRKFIDYKITLGHKANHKFDNNAYFSIVNHILFGRIPCLLARRHIKMHEEIFVNYNYNYETGPRWFRKLYDLKFGKQMIRKPKLETLAVEGNIATYELTLPV